MNNEVPVAPWYRQPWFWFLTIAPLSAITFSMCMLVVASNMKDTMVTDDYSKEGRGINLEIARDQAAKEMGLTADMAFEDRSLILKVNAEQGPLDAPYLILTLFHPTLAQNDRTIQFRNDGNGLYSGTMLQDIDGRWYYELRGPENHWRLKGEAWLPAEGNIHMTSKGAAKG
ncbi:FixH family protein [Marinobacter sp. F3R11]|uniref:FixH family protein n=1 Tax=Marinobacter sp. F3R11 TaxID=2267231 RepID=UPI000DE97A2E|nr:FixH family protein [Marinobacter sp. F3R11]RBW49871.1 nitrogen fixation protein FixH [Marinobacter sp. F3R11]